MPKEWKALYAPSNYQLEQKIKRLQQEPELKYYDYVLGVLGRTTGQLLCLNNTEEGTGANRRVGDWIKLTSLQWRGHLFYDIQEPEIQSAKYPRIRILIFWDKEADGTPTLFGKTGVGVGVEGVLDTTTITNAVNAPYMRQTQKRFKILYDQTYDLRGGLVYQVDVDDYSAITVPFISMQNKISLSREVVYKEPDNEVGSITSNSLWVACVSDVGASPPNIISGQIGFRIYFKDE